MSVPVSELCSMKTKLLPSAEKELRRVRWKVRRRRHANRHQPVLLDPTLWDNPRMCSNSSRPERAQEGVGAVARRQPDPRRAALGVALTAFLAATAWLVLSVVGIYDGQVSGLFYTGSKTALPTVLAQSHTRRGNDETGYDAQFYHLIAHDPLIRRSFVSYIDNPRLRWRRIGLPGLAALLVAGSDRYVDYTYIGIQLGFVLLGAFWLGRYAQQQGRHPAWGLAFLLVPAVLVSLDRMTVDLPLAALCIGFVLYGTTLSRTDVKAPWVLYAILIAAALVRETGMILVAAWCLHCALQRNWRSAVLGANCGIPTLAWWLYVHSRTPIDGTPWLATYPFSGIIERTVQGIDAPLFTTWLRVTAGLEEVAIAGIWLALLIACVLAWTGSWGLVELTAILFVAFSATLGKFDIWASAYATGRTMSPLLIMLGLLFLRGRSWAFALPLLLVLPRIALQYQAQLKLALQGIR